MNKILFLLGMVAVSLNVRGVNVMDRPLTEREKHSFCEVMNLSSFQVVDRFAKCSRSNIEGKSIDGRLHNLLVDVASNQHGKRMLSFVIAKVEPSVKCAKTLMYMSEILSFPSDKSVKCALNFLDELIPFSDASDLERKLCKIKKARDDLLINPKEFSCKEDENVSEKIGNVEKTICCFWRGVIGIRMPIDGDR